MKIIAKGKLTSIPEYIGTRPSAERFDEKHFAKCHKCGTALRKPAWGRITTEDLDVLELENTVYNIEIVQECLMCGALNRMVYADNLSDETLMMVEKEEKPIFVPLK